MLESMQEKQTNKKHSALCRLSSLELSEISTWVRRCQEEKRWLQKLKGNFFYTEFTVPWEAEFGQGLCQFISSNLPDCNQHNPWAHLCTPQSAHFNKADPILHLSRSDPLNWFPGPEHRLAFDFLAASASTIRHLTNLIPLHLVPEGSRSATFKGSVHKIMNKGLT